MKIKTFLTVTLCAVAVLWSCKKGDEPVTPKVSAAFTSTVDALTGGVVTFTNTSENATSYAWDFGDGNTLKEKNPTHKYTKSGNYTVKLTATNAGGSDEETKTIIIKLKGTDTDTDTQLIANFTHKLGTEGTVTFTNTSENATGYTWDFGDGNTSNAKDTTYTFIENKDYAIKLTVTNSAGESTDTTKIITITNAPPIATFKFKLIEDAQGAGGTVNFENTSLNTTGYVWDFGDGNTSKEENPTHTYAQNRAYEVKLTATNEGRTDDTTQTVTIDNIITISIADLSKLSVLKNSPDGVVIWKIVATVSNSDKTPVYSLLSQNPVGVIDLEGDKIVISNLSAFDSQTHTEITGEIQGTIGSVTATATFTIKVIDDPDAGIYIPDANFKAVLLNTTGIDANGDKKISVAEAQSYKVEILASNQSITDATGIEYFTNIIELNLSGNALTKINVSRNAALTILRLNDNQLTDVDVHNNTALTELGLDNNQLTAIDVSRNTRLTHLSLYGNELTAMDVSNNTVLTFLRLDNNQLTAIDVSNNTKLTELFLSKNQLTTLDVSQNMVLNQLWLFQNALTTLDVSKNTVLDQLLLYQNALTTLDVSKNTVLTELSLENNQLTKVNLANGNNDKFTDLNLTNNPNLTCVQVDSPLPSPLPNGWKVDSGKEGVFQTTECSN